MKVSSAQAPSIADDCESQAKSTKYEETSTNSLEKKDNISNDGCKKLKRKVRSDVQKRVSDFSSLLTRSLFNEKVFEVEAGQKSSPITISKKRARPSSSLSSRIFGKKQKVNLFSAEAHVTVDDCQSNCKSSKDGVEAGLGSPTISVEKTVEAGQENSPINISTAEAPATFDGSQSHSKSLEDEE